MSLPDPLSNESVAKRLKEFAESKFGSMAALARALKKSPQHLTPYSTGKFKPGNDLQEELRLLGCDIEWLMTGKKSDSTKLVPDGVTYWEARVGHMTEQEAKDLRKFIEELLNEEDPVQRKTTIDVARVVLKKRKKKKE